MDQVIKALSGVTWFLAGCYFLAAIFLHWPDRDLIVAIGLMVMNVSNAVNDRED